MAFRVVVIFVIVAIPLAASVRFPVPPVGIQTRASLQAAIVIAPADVSLINVTVKSEDKPEDSVQVRAVVSADGW